MAEEATRRLVLVVHGVGHVEPGETVGLLASSLKNSPDVETTATTHHIVEDPRFSHRKGPDVFTCRTLRRKGSTSDELFAEVYWADVAVAKVGVVQVLLELFQVILGLGHLVRESADRAYAHNKALRWMANAGVRMLHGPIAAINTVVLLTAFMAMFMEMSGYSRIIVDEDTRFLWPCLFGAALIAVSLVLHWQTERYLMKAFFRSVVATCLVMMAFSVTWYLRDNPIDWPKDAAPATPVIAPSDSKVDGDNTHVPLTKKKSVAVSVKGRSSSGATPIVILPVATVEPEPNRLDRMIGWLRTKICSWEEAKKTSSTAGQGARTCEQSLTGMYQISMVLVVIQWFIWIGLLFVTTAFLLTHWVNRTYFSSRGYRMPPALAPIVLSSMMLFWPLMLSCIWAVMIFTYPGFGGHRSLFIAAFHPVYVNWLIMALILVMAIWVTFGPYRRFVATVRPAAYFREGDGPQSPPRMIVANPIGNAIMACPPLLLIVMVLLTFRTFEPQSVQDTLIDQFVYSQAVDDLDRWSRENFNELFLLGLLLAGGLYALRTQLVSGIGIASDVINFMRIWQWEPDPEKRVYPQRERIDGRFVSVAHSMIERHDPEEIVVVTHSQGTVVALESLRREKGFFDSVDRPDRRWKLITMGSPFTHLYQHYFGSQFDVPTREALYLDDWINIFRIDDFIGTHIGDDRLWPRQHPVSKGGHAFYWVDPAVERYLHPELSSP